MDMILIGSLVVGVLIIAWAFLSPRGSAPMASQEDPFSDLTSLMRSDIRHREKQLAFAARRFLEGYQTQWAKGMAATRPGDLSEVELIETAAIEPPAKPKRTPRKPSTRKPKDA